MIKLIDKDFAKYRAQGIVDKMIKAVMEISTYRKTVSTYLLIFIWCTKMSYCLPFLSSNAFRKLWNLPKWIYPLKRILEEGSLFFKYGCSFLWNLLRGKVHLMTICYFHAHDSLTPAHGTYSTSKRCSLITRLFIRWQYSVSTTQNHWTSISYHHWCRVQLEGPLEWDKWDLQLLGVTLELPGSLSSPERSINFQWVHIATKSLSFMKWNLLSFNFNCNWTAI